MPQLKVTAHTPVGKFSGRINKDTGVSKEDLENARDTLERQVNSLSYMVLYDGDAEIALPGDLIKNSVLVFEVK